MLYVDHADFTAPNRQHELDHTDRTDHTDNTDNTDHTHHTDHIDHTDHTDHIDHIDHTDHTDHTDHIDHTDHTDHTDQEYVCRETFATDGPPRLQKLPNKLAISRDLILCMPSPRESVSGHCGSSASQSRCLGEVYTYLQRTLQLYSSSGAFGVKAPAS